MSYSPTDSLKDQEVRRELQEVARELEALRSFRVLYAPPFKPRDGNICICDGVSWDPIGNGLKQPIWYDQALDEWFTFAVTND